MGTPAIIRTKINEKILHSVKTRKTPLTRAKIKKWNNYTTKQKTTHNNPKESQMNAFQYRQLLLKQQKQSKYHAKKIEVDGVIYDSKKEANRGAVLKQQERFGIITGLERQVEFVLQPGYTNNKKEKIRPITYKADFVYQKENQKYVEDVKGFKTPEYRLKKKIFEYKYPEYTFVES